MLTSGNFVSPLWFSLAIGIFVVGGGVSLTVALSLYAFSFFDVRF